MLSRRSAVSQLHPRFTKNPTTALILPRRSAAPCDQNGGIRGEVFCVRLGARVKQVYGTSPCRLSFDTETRASVWNDLELVFGKNVVGLRNGTILVSLTDA